jgi:hypothetical protein
VITEHTICALPEDHPGWRHFVITVEFRGGGTWAVCHQRDNLSTTCDWDFEDSASSRDDEWLARHRFDLDTALRLAEEQAPLMTCVGISALQALAGQGKWR